MSGEVTPVMMAALTVGLRVKKETVGEIAAAAQVMREFATKVVVADHEHLVDIVGTGGDASHTFNISTASMFVAAAAGARIAKHGGRSVSSKSGSADVLEALGANIMLKPEQVAQSIAETGIGFMFRPSHHSAMKHAAPVRKELGVRTIFNILGPLTNPAGAPNQLPGRIPPRSRRHPGTRAAAPWQPTRAGRLRQGRHGRSLARRRDHGRRAEGRRSARIRNPSRGLRLADDLEPGAQGDRRTGVENDAGRGACQYRRHAARIVILNAGTALYAANVAATIKEGIDRAREAVASGAARKKLDQFVATTQKLGSAG
jgi:anthranilate phosphoribosyltransferase